MNKPINELESELQESLTIEGDVDTDNREILEMNILTAMMCVSRFSKTGQELINNASDEILTDMLNEYSRVRIIY